jgi:hypothetical protein
MLFAPKAGSELRHQIGEQANHLANTASEGYRRATEAAGDWAERGREMYDKARHAVSRGADEAERYVREATSGTGPMSATGGAAAERGYHPGAPMGPGAGGPESIRRS